jgi:probable rRNA maturation factor
MGTAKARKLNRDYRGQDHATNILTFSYGQAAGLFADLVLCLPVMRTEARQQNKRLDHHAAHLIVHGVLHASGMDHQRKEDADAMEWLEAAILSRFRIPSPYAALAKQSNS